MIGKVQTNLSVETMQTLPDQHPREGRRGSGRGNLQKCDYLIQRRTVNCKITPFLVPLEC